MVEHIDLLPDAPAHVCGCGGSHDEAPVLDVRVIPHAIRHGSVFGAFSAIPPGGSMVIIAPHRPSPLLAQLAEREPVEVDVLVDGPEAWHIRLTRPASA
jgi:uncharacterized protein (DUF2249 family)